jgi:hypothetical protein
MVIVVEIVAAVDVAAGRARLVLTLLRLQVIRIVSALFSAAVGIAAVDLWANVIGIAHDNALTARRGRPSGRQAGEYPRAPLLRRAARRPRVRFRRPPGHRRRCRVREGIEAVSEHTDNVAIAE